METAVCTDQAPQPHAIGETELALQHQPRRGPIDLSFHVVTILSQLQAVPPCTYIIYPPTHISLHVVTILSQLRLGLARARGAKSEPNPAQEYGSPSM